MKPRFCLHIPLGLTTITIGPSWLVVVPATISAIGLLYVPILGSFLNRAETWTIAIVIAGLMGLSLVTHVGAHVWMARATGSPLPEQLALYLLGDAAQVWPAASSAWRDFLVASAGPLASLLLAVVAYLLWNAQLNPYLTIVTIFLLFFNGGLALVNLTPAFPLDGGRLLRAIGWGVLAQPVMAARLSIQSGYLLAAALLGWALYLLAQQTRVSRQTSTTTLLFAGLIGLMLWKQPAWQWERSPLPRTANRVRLLLRALPAGLLVLSMWAVTLSLVPVNQGLEAPGPVVSVMPMITLPPAKRHPFTGAFLLTTVMPQTPILLGEWLYGQLSPAVAIMPPEKIVPPDTTAQIMARQQYRMLEESETTAIVVGLRLAGYPVEATGRGVRVLSILPDSPNRGTLQPDDIIIGLQGQTITTPNALRDQLTVQGSQTHVPMQVERNGQKLALTASLLPPATEGQAPRLGITMESAGIAADLPFPVKIEPQKVTGGPSAGLLFTLAVYNLVTPDDLTGGRTIAGTGTIDLDGVVGPIGGVQQKVFGAEWSGAEYFLSPAENYKDALAAARRIKVVKVETAAQAIQFLRTLPPREGQP